MKDLKIKNNLAALRLKKNGTGITKATLAHNISVHRSFITRIEQGKVKPSLITAHKIAKFFNCQIEDVFEFVPFHKE